MKSLLLAALLLLGGCTAAVVPPAPRELVGVISNDLTLSGEILLSDDLLILPGRTLTLLPGTTVHIRRAESTKIDPEYLSSATEILVRGTLKIEGTADAPVSFLPDPPALPGEVAWAGIILDHSASELRHSRIEGAEQGVVAIGGTPQINDSTLFNCRYGLVLQGTSEGVVTGNRVDSGEGGLFLLAGAKAVVDGNRITRQAEEGLFIDGTSQPQLGRNEITLNESGVVLHNPSLVFDRSGISGNRQDLMQIEEGAWRRE